MKKSLSVLAVALFASAAGGCVNIALTPQAKMQTVLVEPSGRLIELNRIAIVDVDGFIQSADEPRFPWGGTSVADVKERLLLATEDSRVKAVILRVNSPGGEVSACDMIYDELRRFRRETGKPVVAMMLGTATSGGYYVSLGADRIVAAPTTVTGSVGVVMQFLSMRGLLAKVGVRSEVIKSGARKDIGSPWRDMTDEEREILQNVNESLFERFARMVRERRSGMTDADFAVISDGRIVTADEALALHMTDRTGYLEDALAEARALAGVTHADVVLYRPYSHYNTNIYAQPGGVGWLDEGLDLIAGQRGPAFLYLWSPGR